MELMLIALIMFVGNFVLTYGLFQALSRTKRGRADVIGRWRTPRDFLVLSAKLTALELLFYGFASLLSALFPG